MNNRKKSVYNLICSTFGQLITIGIGLVLPRLFIISYGSDVNGLLTSINEILVYLSLFEAGVGALAMQALYKPVANDNKGSINAILSAVNIHFKKITFFYLLSLLIIAFVYPLIVQVDLPYIWVFLIILFSGLGNVIVFFFQIKYKVLLQAEGKNYLIVNSQTIILVLTNSAKLVLILLGFNVVAVVISTFFINLIQTAFILVYIKKNYKYVDLSVKPNMSALNQTNSMLVHQVSGLIFYNTDVLVLTLFCGLDVVSVYSIYKMIVMNIGSFVGIILSSVSFHMGQTFNTNIKLFKKMIDAFEMYYSSIAFALMVVTLNMFMSFITLYTQGVSDTNYILTFMPLLVVAIELLTYMRVPMMSTINYAGHFKQTQKSSVIETIINVTVSLSCVYFLGIYGVLIGTVCALLFRTNDVIIYTNTKILCRSPKHTYLIHAVNITLFVSITFLYNLLNIGINSYWDFVVVAFPFTVISIIVFSAVQSFIFRENLKFALKIIKK